MLKPIGLSSWNTVPGMQYIYVIARREVRNDQLEYSTRQPNNIYSHVISTQEEYIPCNMHQQHQNHTKISLLLYQERRRHASSPMAAYGSIISPLATVSMVGVVVVVGWHLEHSHNGGTYVYPWPPAVAAPESSLWSSAFNCVGQKLESHSAYYAARTGCVCMMYNSIPRSLFLLSYHNIYRKYIPIGLCLQYSSIPYHRRNSNW